MHEIVTAFVSALLGALVPILIARYSKTKAERDSGLAMDYLKLADMSGEQLEKKINFISQMDQRINELEAKSTEQELENVRLKEMRNERDDKIEAMEAHIAALDAQIKRDLIETDELHKKYQKLKEFTESLIAALQKKGINLPELDGGIPDSIKFKWEKKE